MTLFYLSAAWVLGLFLASLGSFSLPALAALAVPALAAATMSLRWPRLLLASVCLLVLLLGMTRLSLARPVPSPNQISFYNDGPAVEMRGLVASYPETRENTQRLLLDVEEVLEPDGPKRVSGKALITLRLFPTYEYGDRLRMVGRLETPPIHPEFDYREYLARQGVASILRYPQVSVLESGQGFKPLQGLYWLRRRMAEAIAAALPEPQASLAQGMFLGLRRDMPPQLNRAFARTGTTHVVAISGLNLSLVAGLLSSVFLPALGRRRALPVVLGAIILYAFLTGLAPSVMRAALMVGMVMVAAYFGRPVHLPTSLAFAAAFLSAGDPFILWDVGFQLSFLATAGLVYLAPPLTQWSQRLSALKTPPISIVVETTAVSIASYIATLPLIPFYFSRLSLVGVPATLLTLWTTPFIIVTSFVVAVAGLFSAPLGQISGWAAWLPLSYLTSVVQLWAGFPGAAIDLPVSQAAVWGYFGALTTGLVAMSQGRRILSWYSKAPTALLRWRPGFLDLGVVFAAIIALATWYSLLTYSPAPVRVTFLDVGQGDAILIQTQNYHILVDGGPNPSTLMRELSQYVPLARRRFDLVVLTHPEADHITGLIEVVRRYSVAKVLDNGQVSSNPEYVQWSQLLKDKKIPRYSAQAGEIITLEKGVVLSILHPHQVLLQGTSSDSNNNSLVAKLAAGQVSFLLTADIQEEGERLLLNDDIRSTVLKVAHHGSQTSTSAAFLRQVSPQVAVISVGEDNPFGHPHPDILARLKGMERLFRTDEDGTIRLTTDGSRLWAKAMGKTTRDRQLPRQPVPRAINSGGFPRAP
ncbi:MAG: DNA internalization-related competence protein ComEC/Rec2 [Chloroflexi bacterium]|nr:DNA internalization-related competence protein ComEC/Rec2 [Chloroflexota bacterium]